MTVWGLYSKLIHVIHSLNFNIAQTICNSLYVHVHVLFGYFQREHEPIHLHHNPSLLSPSSTNEESIPESLQTNKHDVTMASFKKYSEVCEEKRKIEKIRMDQEVEIRQLKYKIEELEEELVSTGEEKDKLLV